MGYSRKKKNIPKKNCSRKYNSHLKKYNGGGIQSYLQQSWDYIIPTTTENRARINNNRDYYNNYLQQKKLYKANMLARMQYITHATKTLNDQLINAFTNQNANLTEILDDQIRISNLIIDQYMNQNKDVATNFNTWCDLTNIYLENIKNTYHNNMTHIIYYKNYIYSVESSKQLYEELINKTGIEQIKQNLAPKINLNETSATEAAAALTAAATLTAAPTAKTTATAEPTAEATTAPTAEATTTPAAEATTTTPTTTPASGGGGTNSKHTIKGGFFYKNPVVKGLASNPETIIYIRNKIINQLAEDTHIDNIKKNSNVYGELYKLFKAKYDSINDANIQIIDALKKLQDILSQEEINNNNDTIKKIISDEKQNKINVFFSNLQPRSDSGQTMQPAQPDFPPSQNNSE